MSAMTVRAQLRERLDFPLAVAHRFHDDHASDLAAVIAYYAFLSLFPLLLAVVTVLDFALRDNPELQQRILTSALRDFPIIGDHVRTELHSLHGSRIALVVGFVGLLWAGTGAVLATERALNAVQHVPGKAWSGFVAARVRALAMLGVIGLSVLSTAALSAAGVSGGWAALPLRAAELLAAYCLVFGTFLAAFRILPAVRLPWRDLVPGAAFGALAWTVVQSVGTFYIAHRLRGAGDLYGTFAVVIGLLAWLGLLAQITMLSAEMNAARLDRSSSCSRDARARRRA